MRIGIDIRSLMEKNYSGVAHYTHKLVRAMLQEDGENEYVLFYNTARDVKIPEFSFPNLKIEGFHYPNKYFNPSLRFFSFPKLDEMLGGLDLFFLPNLQFAALKKSKILLTIHDLSYEFMKENLSWKSRVWHKLVRPKKLCEMADHIIAVSEHTKNDLINIYNIPPQKITVVYHGIEKKFRRIEDGKILQKIRERYQLPEKFIFSIGNIEPRKNIGALIESYKISKLFPEYHLVFAGAQYKKNYLKDCVGDLKNYIHFIGYVPEDDKPALYSLASLFAYISLYEGFGLPLLEAMACKTPFVASHTGGMGEVAGSAGILCDPYDIHDISRAMQTLLFDRGLQERLTDMGLVRSQEFTWTRAAQKTIEIMKRI